MKSNAGVQQILIYSILLGYSAMFLITKAHLVI